MNDVPTVRVHESDVWGPLKRFILTVIVFALILPGIGGALTALGYYVPLFGIPSFTNAGLAMAGAMAYGLWLSYPIGLIAGGGMGFIVAARDRVGGTSLPEAAFIGVAAGVLWAIFAAEPHERGRFTYIVIGATLLATLLAWWLTRWMRRWG